MHHMISASAIDWNEDTDKRHAKFKNATISMELRWVAFWMTTSLINPRRPRNLVIAFMIE